MEGDDAIEPVEMVEGAGVAPASAPPPVAVPQSTVLLIVNLMGTGTGTVVTSPAGISCAGGFGLRCVRNVTPGTVVTLAQAPDAGSTFAGWGGACSGTAACQIIVRQQTLVVATFRVPPPIVVQYYHLDALGTVRAVTGDNGALMRQVDYGPFGEGLAGIEPQPVPPGGKQQRFTGKERDVETSLDYFEARYYRSTWGRFTTTDPGHVGGNVYDSQSWNAYAYARNNALRFVDPTGTDYSVCQPGGPCARVSDDEWERAIYNLGWGFHLGHGEILAWVDGRWRQGVTFTWVGPEGPRNQIEAFQLAGDQAADALAEATTIIAKNALAAGAITGLRWGAEALTVAMEARAASMVAAAGAKSQIAGVLKQIARGTRKGGLI